MWQYIILNFAFELCNVGQKLGLCSNEFSTIFLLDGPITHLVS